MYKTSVFLSQQKKPKFDSLAIISTDKPTVVVVMTLSRGKEGSCVMLFLVVAQPLSGKR